MRAMWRPVLNYACKGGLNLCGPEAFRAQAALAADALAWYYQYARWYAALRRRPTVVLDAFCGMGGASEGASRIPGVRVVGVDIAPQPAHSERFGLFCQGDALDKRLLAALHRQHRFDVVMCSPPCQAYSTGRMLNPTVQPALIDQATETLQTLGVPLIVENVTGAHKHMPAPTTLLRGCHFGLRTDRPRLFGSPNTALHLDLALKGPGEKNIREHACLGPRRRYSRLNRFGMPERRPCCAKGNIFSPMGGVPYKSTLDEEAAAMGYGKPWPGMTYAGLRESIPPAYSSYLVSITIARLLHEETQCPFISYDEACERPEESNAALASWAESAFKGDALARALTKNHRRREKNLPSPASEKKT